LRTELQSALQAARELAPDELPGLLGEIEEIRCTAMARLIAPAAAPSSCADELLPIEEASRRLGVSEDYLYRHKDEMPFSRRIGRKVLFSSRGIERYIQNDGLTARRRAVNLTPTPIRGVGGKR
jgi:excisionase family DNA binding protein